MFIEKITLNSIQDWWRLDISQHQTVQSVSGIWLVSVDSFCCPCRRCLVSWVGPFFLPYKKRKIYLDPFQYSQMLYLLFPYLIVNWIATFYLLKPTFRKESLTLEQKKNLGRTHLYELPHNAFSAHNGRECDRLTAKIFRALAFSWTCLLQIHRNASYSSRPTNNYARMKWMEVMNYV